MQGKDLPTTPVSETHNQQAYIDERHEVLDLPEQATEAEELPTEATGVPPFVESFSHNGTGSASSSAGNAVSAKETRANQRGDSPLPKRQALQPPPPTPTKRDASPSLSSQMKRNKVTGKGVEMLEKISFIFDTEYDHPDKVGFIQVRLAAPKAKKVPARKPPKKKDGDKNLSYAACSPEIQKGLRASRVAEWQKWRKFNAGVLFVCPRQSYLLKHCIKLNILIHLSSSVSNYSV